MRRFGLSLVILIVEGMMAVVCRSEIVAVPAESAPVVQSGRPSFDPNSDGGDTYEDVARAGVDVDLGYLKAGDQLTHSKVGLYTNVNGKRIDRAFMVKMCVDKLRRAQANLDAHGGNCKLSVYDALRPRSAQRVLFNALPDGNFVANPNHSGGSPHNRGLAVDVQIKCDGRLLEMGSPIDKMGAVAGEEGLHTISARARANRIVLKTVMTSAGFFDYKKEWWHFNCLPARSMAYSKYKVVE